MKNIYEIAKSCGIEIPADKKEAFDKEFKENYKTVADYNKQKEKLDSKTDELKTANDNIKELKESMESFEGSEEQIKDLQAKVNKYEQENKEREQAEKDRIADEQLTAVVTEAIGDKEFINDYTRTSIIAEVKKGVLENKGKGAADILAEITKDKEGIFKNPQRETKLPKAKTDENEPGSEDFPINW